MGWAGAHCAYSQDFGPIETRNQRSISLAFLRFNPVWGIVPAGKQQTHIAFNAANESRFLAGGAVQEDSENDRLIFGYRKGLGGGREFYAEIPLIARNGGFLDPVITWWHANILHWQDPFRASQPYGRSLIHVPGATFGPAGGFGDLTLGESKHFSRKLIGSVALKLPTGDAHTLLGSGRPDAGFGFKYRTKKGNWALHAQSYAIYQGGAVALPNPRRWVDQEVVAFVWEKNSRDAWVFQWQTEASSTRTGISGSDAAHRMLVIGFDRKLSKDRMLELHFCEDRDVFNGRWPEGANIAPDFSIGIAYNVRF